MILITILVFLIILTILVIIHEAGHFFTAKFFGVKVEEFGFGFPPRALSIKRGETIYSINWLPIGGFVKLYGEDDAGGGKVTIKSGSDEKKVKTQDISRAFFARPAWQRLLIILAGVVMNMLLAFVIYYFFLFFSGFHTELQAYGSYHFWGADQKNLSQIIVSDVQKDSPAAKAGIHAASTLVALNNRPVTRSAGVQSIIKQYQGKQLLLTLQDLRTQKIQTVTLIPRVHPAKGQGAVGIGFSQFQTMTISYDTPIQKVFSGITYPINFMTYNFVVLGQFIHVAMQTHNAGPVVQNVSGPIGIGSIVNICLTLQSNNDKFLCILNISGAISASLAVFNILPIPALDGGRFFFVLVEFVFRKKINPNTESLIHTIGMVVLLALVLLITFKDIYQLIP